MNLYGKVLLNSKNAGPFLLTLLLAGCRGKKLKIM